MDGFSRRWKVVAVRVFPVVSDPAPTNVRASKARRHAALSAADRSGDSNILCTAFGFSSFGFEVLYEPTIEFVLLTISCVYDKYLTPLSSAVK